MKITLYDKTHWFRSESELQNEGKGGFLRGEITVDGIDVSKEKIHKLELYLVSGHDSELHSNLLRIAGKDFKRRENANQKENYFMSPSAYKVILLRDSANTFRINTTDHDSYLPSDIKDIPFWDEERQTLTLGDRGGLPLTIVKPLSKQEHGTENGKHAVHIRDVLKRRKEDEINEDLEKNRNEFRTQAQQKQEFDRRMKDFDEKELCTISRKRKNADKNHETLLSFLSEGEMHKARLKVVCWITSQKVENEEDNNNKGDMRKIEGYSEVIMASNRYAMEIDKIRTNVTVLDHASLQVLTIILNKCKATLKMKFDAEFLYQQKGDDGGLKQLVSDSEIKIIKVNDDSIVRVGGGQTLQLFINTTCGTILNMVKRKDLVLFLKLKVLDDSGLVGAEDMIEVGCVEHSCGYDATLAHFDTFLNMVIQDETISHLVSTNKLECTPCPLCLFQGCHARKQYHAEVECESLSKGKRRSSNSSDGDHTMESKRHKNIGKSIKLCFMFMYNNINIRMRMDFQL